jgi:cytidylate kinase
LTVPAKLTITISRQYGAAALGVARALEKRTGYHIVEDQIASVVAARLEISKEAVTEEIAGPPPLGERILRGLGIGLPELASSAPTALELGHAVRGEVEKTIRGVAEEGNAIIVGWIANIVLGVRPDVLRVFLHAPLEWRVARIMESFHLDANAAKVEVERVDAERRAYAKAEYGIVYGDPRYYDVVIDTARFGIDGAAGAIAAIAGFLHSE